MTNVLPDTGNDTINLAHARLRLFEERQRINPAYLHSAETLIIDYRTGQPYHLPKAPTFVPLGHDTSGADAWIGEIPVIPWPPAPPAGPEPAAAEVSRPPFGRPGKRRRLLPPWQYVLGGAAGGAVAAYLGFVLAALVVMS